MELVKKAENTLADLFKGAPKLSDSVKVTLVKIVPWLALLGGVGSALAAYNVYQWATAVDTINDFYRSVGVDTGVNRFSVWIWLSLVMLAVQAVLLLMAFPKLQKLSKAGWDLLFLVGLLELVFAVVSLFSDYTYGGGSGFVGYLIGAVITFWLLFAVRDKYKKV